MNSERIQNIYDRIQNEKGKYQLLISQRKKVLETIASEKETLNNAQEAHNFLIQCSKEVLSYLQVQVTDLVSSALDAVFEEPYELVFDFVNRRNKTEIDISFCRKGTNHKISPIKSSGCGAVEIAAFALRVALWSLEKPKTRKVFLLDEPFKFVSVDYQPLAGELIKSISTKLGVQFIIISHSPHITNKADKIFKVGQKNGVSYIKPI